MWKIEKVVSSGRYNRVLVAGHPNSTKNGYVLEHRIIMENHLGRLLKSDEVVHHINNNSKDNNLSNLQLMTSKEHTGLHSSLRGAAWVDLKCIYCGEVFSRRRGQTHLIKGSGYTSCSRSCGVKTFIKLRDSESPDARLSLILTNVVREYRVPSRNPPVELFTKYKKPFESKDKQVGTEKPDKRKQNLIDSDCKYCDATFSKGTKSHQQYCSVGCYNKSCVKLDITKESLEYLVWLLPASKLGHFLGVTDSTIGKLCKKLGISKPKRGYWAKLKAKRPSH